MPRIRIGAVLTIVALSVAAAVAQPSLPLESVLSAPDLPQHRPVPHRRVGDGDCRAGNAGARSPLHHLRGDTLRRVVEDDQRGHYLEGPCRIRPASAAVGSVAIAPSDSRIVWMGTGDQANARSSYSGKGVFKSIDGGATWQDMGLSDSHHIARIVIHPTNPDVVYVAAIGHLFSTNDERGVFRTTGRRQDVEESALRQQRRRGDRSGDQPPQAGRPLRRDVRQGAPAVGNRRKRPGERRLPHRRRRRPVATAGRRAADREDRPHRPRHLPEEPADPLRARREPEPEAGRGRRRRQRHRAARLGHHRQRTLSHGRRGEDLAEGDGA